MEKAKISTACINSGLILKIQLPETDESKTIVPKEHGGELQLDFQAKFTTKKTEIHKFH